ncbi:phosphoethanolamine transferase EptA family protein [Acinetobacter baumannii OIFC098]|nr:phosphoethanolamine transferase EptA family protein [Acinetobacter baumannii OIFC098]
MFSGMPRVGYDEQLASHREGLLDIAKRAGYQVTWIDNNSGCKGDVIALSNTRFQKT